MVFLRRRVPATHNIVDTQKPFSCYSGMAEDWMEEDSESSEESEGSPRFSLWLFLSWPPVLLGTNELIQPRFIGTIGALILAAIPAIIFGHIALYQARHNWQTSKGEKLAFVGLVLGYFLGVIFLAKLFLS